MHKFFKQTSALTLAAGMIAAAGTAAQAQVVTGDVPFTADVPQTCTLTVNNGGVLAASDGTFTQLSSRGTFGAQPGSAGNVTIGTNIGANGNSQFNRFQVSVGLPAADAWVGPMAADVLDPTFEVNGTVYTAADSLRLNQNRTDMDVHLAASSLNGPFAVGQYTGTVVVTCEPFTAP